MLLKYLVASFIFLCATCCPEDDCEAVLCEGPPDLSFEVLAENENVFINGTYSLEDISITGDGSDEVMISLANSAVPNSVLVLINPNWTPESYQYELNFSDDAVVTLNVEIINSPSGGCCGGIPRLEALQINGIAQSTNGGYTIILD